MFIRTLVYCVIASLLNRAVVDGVDTSSMQVLEPSPYGGPCGIMRGCEEGLTCVGTVGRCVPLDCIVESLKLIDEEFNTSEEGGGRKRLFRNLDKVDGDTVLDDTTDMQQYMPEETTVLLEDFANEVAKCRGDIVSEDANKLGIPGVTAFVGVGAEVQLIGNFYGFAGLAFGGTNSTGVLIATCQGIGLGAEIGVFGVVGAFLVDDPNGSWTLLEVADLVPVAIDIPTIFFRNSPTGGFELGFAFAIGLTGGVDTFSQSTCTIMV